MIVALAGGVGAARFLTGLARCVAEEELVVIVNTGDDIDLFGLHISPDVDIVTYTLAGIVDEAKGWGIKDDSFHCLDMMRQHGADAWFNLGDRDLATHILRTQQLRQGKTLTEVTDQIRRALNVKATVLPMSNNPFQTYITTPRGTMHFEEYFVKHQCREDVLGVEFRGASDAEPAPGVLEAISDAELVVVCPSNPIVSIGTILSVAGVRQALRQTDAKVAAVSPIVAGSPLKGPADKMMRCFGLEVSAFGVAQYYSDFLDAIVIDRQDSALKGCIEALGVYVAVENTVMKSLSDKVLLAQAVLAAKAKL
ncbi:MAG: 2-phospho-L-lactate transferase [Candidatus Bathyarchaeota archaeon]|nr:2-phospho-L-lactate transferase [Candidatus Bathyarchaeota archaeon]